MKRPRGLAIYSAFALVFLHAPLLILILFSFNDSRFTVWEGFSLRWYLAALHDPQLMEGLIQQPHHRGIIAAVISTIIGTPGGLWHVEAIRSFTFRYALSFAGDAGDRHRRILAGVVSVGFPLPSFTSGTVYRGRGPRGFFHRLRHDCDFGPSWKLDRRWRKPPWTWGPRNGTPSRA